MEEQIVARLLAGASLRCVMQPNDEIPTNRPLHDECFQLPHIIVDGNNFTAITGRDIVTIPGKEWPIVFYYTNYRDLFGTLDPVRVEPGFKGGDNVLRMSMSPRKRYRKFEWLLNEDQVKVWDSQEGQDLEAIRAAVLRAAPMKAVFLDEEQVWNIHPVILPQVACQEKSFLLQTAYIPYPQVIRRTQEIEKFIDTNPELRLFFNDDRQCFEGLRASLLPPFHAFYHLTNDGTYKSYYDLARGNTTNSYQRLMVFAQRQ